MGVAVHGVALPDDSVAGGLDGFDVGGQDGLDLLGSVAGDKGDFSDFLVGVDDVEEAGEFVGVHAGPDLDSDRVLDPAEVFYVCSVELAGTVADPEEVGGGVVMF